VRYIIGDIKLAILLEQNTQVAVSAHDVIGTAIAALSTWRSVNRHLRLQHERQCKYV